MDRSSRVVPNPDKLCKFVNLDIVNDIGTIIGPVLAPSGGAQFFTKVRRFAFEKVSVQTKGGIFDLGCESEQSQRNGELGRGYALKNKHFHHGESIGRVSSWR